MFTRYIWSQVGTFNEKQQKKKNGNPTKVFDLIKPWT